MRWAPGAIGVRVSGDCTLSVDEFTALCDAKSVDTVVLTADASWRTEELTGRRVLVEVVSLDEAVAAVESGADGLIARGSESGGRAGELSTFVLLQQLLADERVAVGVWAAGGIGPHTAAAAVLGGAAGVVLDSQLALLAEVRLPVAVAKALRTMDGSEPVAENGRQVLHSQAVGEPIAVGQDGCLAAGFARRHQDIGNAIRAVRTAIEEAAHPGSADALRPGSALSRALGTRLPVVQGPMTRVSDEADFAASVAAQGGLPCIALALSTAEQSRAILRRTREQVGDRPWGVGILGFADERTRTAQLEVIREQRPSHVIIAGGRPTQAAAIEDAGIATFLHVPSPGLLSQFLAAGARKFVFEGAECGGHIGPKNSFTLWEAQLAVLEEFLEHNGQQASELQVLFAGGIHDERSAAMVAALTAPLAARGVAVGVLMGTAYLFTEEAVAHGAIRPLFQQQVLGAERTDLLETAPGHATRCVSGPFTEDFHATEDELRGNGVTGRELWERLEQLNVGRLRIASKGIERRGEQLVEVGEARQRGEGLFMAGEVARLRAGVTTIAELHGTVTERAAAFLGERAARLRETLGGTAESAVPEPVDIAVVGMAAMLPGAPDLDTFWSNVLRGVDSITEVPGERWDPRIYYSENGEPGTTSSKWGGFLPEIPFDPLSYGIPPSALGSIEPVQLLALESARRALADAGYADRVFDRARTSVLFGAESGSDLSNASVLRTVLPAYLGELPEELAGQLPELTEDSFPGALANVIAGRIANRLDLGGTNYTVDAACASSLAAVDIACKELATHSSDMVLCGGADLHNGINDYLLFSSVQALSPTGRSRTFDQSADGIALGEGVACLVLKRLADAERDGDRVYAVIKGVGGASDGKSLGLTAPRPEGQRAALERAYRNAGIAPSEVELIEAHGTGTVVGDRTELATLTEMFTEAGARPGGCVLGSVKSQIGHTKCAAGLAGLVKTALALHTGIRPPTLNLSEPNPSWNPEQSPFAFHTEARPWATAPSERVAGISAFGFGGTNFHVVLRGHEGPPPSHALPDWPAELFVFRGASEEAAQRSVRQLLDLLAADETGRLRDFALNTALRTDAQTAPVRIAVVATDPGNLTELLHRALAGEHDPAAGLFRAEDRQPEGELAFLFPGQGSQRVGMLAALFVAFPELHHYLELGEELADLLHPATAFDAEGRAAQTERITDTRVAQPVLGITGLAVHELLGRAGVTPSVVAGHSYGELVALTAAGAIEPESLVALSKRRAEAILDSVGDEPGAMAAVSAAHQKVALSLAEFGLTEQVVVANHNAPEQTVISGPAEAIEQAVHRFRESGLGAKRIPVACAFHSPLVAESERIFAATLAGEPVHEPEIPVYANRTAKTYPDRPESIRAELAAQLANPVRFVEQIESMYTAGVRVFVETGPGAVLSGFVAKILKDRPHRMITTQPGRRGDITDLLFALAQLAVAGAEPRTAWLVDGRGAVDPETATRTKNPQWTVNGQLVRNASGEIPAGALAPARRIQENTVFSSRPSNGSPGDPEALIAEFLRSSREMVNAQRDVLLSYLGPAAGTAAPRPTLDAVPAPNPELPTVESIPAPAATKTAAEQHTEPQPAADIPAVVLGVIADRTGYPAEMIEPELDLEADLSIDSIKRAEIAGEIGTRLGIQGTLADEQMEELTKARSIAAITSWLTERLDGEPETAEPVTEEAPEPVTGEAPRRFELRQVPLTAATGAPDSLPDKRFLFVGEDRLAEALGSELARHGAELLRGAADQEPSEHVDGLIHAGHLSDVDTEALPEAFPLYRTALGNGARWLIALGPDGGAGHSAGLRGFFRTVAREYPDTLARLVELDPETAPAELAASVADELCRPEPAPVVRRSGSDRYGLEPVEASLGALATNGSGPAGTGVSEARAIGLDQDSVVLLFGGGRGITARFAGLLAVSSQCRIHLAGRTPPPDGPEDPAIAAATTPAELRSAVIRTGVRSPADVEREVSRILAQREVSGTLAELRALGSDAEYHTLDVRDGNAVASLVKQVHAEHGRLDGVVHAAGVLADRLIAEKDLESFSRVYDTKVGGARALLDELTSLDTKPSFTVFFGSIAAVYGNRGQADYAAANDALETIGANWAARTGNRALTVHWGPWAATGNHDGMVTRELMREYDRRGIRLIDPEEGVLALLRELAWGEQGNNAVVYTASGW